MNRKHRLVFVLIQNLAWFVFGIGLEKVIEAIAIGCDWQHDSVAIPIMTWRIIIAIAMVLSSLFSYVVLGFKIPTHVTFFGKTVNTGRLTNFLLSLFSAAFSIFTSYVVFECFRESHESAFYMVPSAFAGVCLAWKLRASVLKHMPRT